jgi:hypothetical protein
MDEILQGLTTPKAQTNSLIILLPTKGDLALREMDIDSAANFLTWNQRCENALYEKAVAAHAYQYPTGWMGTLWNAYRDDIRQKLRRFEIIRLINVPDGRIDAGIVDFVREASHA